MVSRGFLHGQERDTCHSRARRAPLVNGEMKHKTRLRMVWKPKDDEATGKGTRRTSNGKRRSCSPAGSCCRTRTRIVESVDGAFGESIGGAVSAMTRL